MAGTRPAVYLDLESEADRAKLAEPELYLAQHADKLVILDEIQRTPSSSGACAASSMQGRRRGQGKGRFLVLGSASIDLLRQSSESLAGRIRYLELAPLDAGEIGRDRLDALWLRGGFPESLLARSDAASLRWRLDFIRTYLERDVPQLGPRIPAETLRRFWTMLAHQQGGLLNAAALARALAVGWQDGHRLPRPAGGPAARAPPDAVAREHPQASGQVTQGVCPRQRTGPCAAGDRRQRNAAGAPGGRRKLEGLAIESLIGAAPSGTDRTFFAPAAGEEIDLLLKLPGHRHPWAIEIERGLRRRSSEVSIWPASPWDPERRLVVYGGIERFPLADGVEAVSLGDLYPGAVRGMSQRAAPEQMTVESPQ